MKFHRLPPPPTDNTFASPVLLCIVFVTSSRKNLSPLIRAFHLQFILCIFVLFLSLCFSRCVKTRSKSCFSLWRALKRYIVGRHRHERQGGTSTVAFEATIPEFNYSFVHVAHLGATTIGALCIREPESETYEGSDWILSKWHLVSRAAN